MPHCSLCYWVCSYLVAYPSFPPIGVVGAVSPVITSLGASGSKAQMVAPCGGVRTKLLVNQRLLALLEVTQCSQRSGLPDFAEVGWPFPAPVKVSQALPAPSEVGQAVTLEFIINKHLNGTSHPLACQSPSLLWMIRKRRLCSWVSICFFPDVYQYRWRLQKKPLHVCVLSMLACPWVSHVGSTRECGSQQQWTWIINIVLTTIANSYCLPCARPGIFEHCCKNRKAPSTGVPLLLCLWNCCARSRTFKEVDTLLKSTWFLSAQSCPESVLILA